MYLDFFGLKEKPFSLTPDPKFFYASETHKTGLELALHGIKAREGFIVITGAIGTGKTTICRMILHKMDVKTHSALILNPFLSEEELLEQALHDFGIMEKGTEKLSKQEMIDKLNEFLLNRLKEGENALLIIDEAQNLPMPVLEQIRILSNLETDKEKLLQIILVGQLGLLRLLKSPELKQLDQRISVKCQLNPLKKEDIQRYIEYRLMVAGSSGEIHLSPEALDLIHEYSLGIPRIINQICDRALLGAYTQQTTKISKEIVEKAIENLKLEKKEIKMAIPGAGSFTRGGKISLPVLISAIVIGVAAFGFLIWQYVSGLNAKKAQRSLQTQMQQLALARQIERGRYEKELDELKKGVEGLKTRRPAVAAAPVPREFEDSYTIFIGSFKDKPSAVEAGKGLRGLEHKARVIALDSSEKGRQFRLVLGNFKEKTEAEAVRGRLQTRFPDAQVVAFSKAMQPD